MMSKWTENDNWGPFIDAEREGKQYFKFFSREMERERERGTDGRRFACPSKHFGVGLCLATHLFEAEETKI